MYLKFTNNLLLSKEKTPKKRNAKVPSSSFLDKWKKGSKVWKPYLIARFDELVSHRPPKFALLILSGIFPALLFFFALWGSSQEGSEILEEYTRIIVPVERRRKTTTNGQFAPETISPSRLVVAQQKRQQRGSINLSIFISHEKSSSARWRWWWSRGLLFIQRFPVWSPLRGAEGIRKKDTAREGSSLKQEEMSP